MEKAPYRFIQRIAWELACFLIPGIIAGFFLFWNTGMVKDLNHNAANLWYFNSLVNEAHTTGVPVQSLLKEVFSRWTLIPGYFFKGLEQWYVFAVPLSQVWITLISPFIGYGARSAILASSIVGFMAVALTYISGRVYYGRQVGLFSALYLGISLIFILTVRNGYVFYAWDCLLGQLLILLFYLAHKTENKKVLYLSALAFSVGWFNGYSMFLISMPPAMLAFILYSRRKGDLFIFGLKDYIFVSVSAVVLFMAYTAIYSTYLNEGLTEAFLRLHHLFFWRSESMPTPLFKLSSFAINLKRGFLILFYKSYLPPSIIASGDNVSPYGQPGISLFVTAFLIIGLVTMFRLMTMVNRLLLCVLGVSAFFIFCMLVFDTRYIMVVLPFVYISAGVGTQKFIDLFKGKSGTAYTMAAFMILLPAVGYTVYKNYDFYFNEFGVHEGYLGRFSGQVQAGRFVTEEYDPRDTVVVLGDKLTVNEDIFAFSTLPKSFEYRFWEDIRNNLRGFEDAAFKKKEKIVFVFSNGHSFLEMPGVRNSDPVDWEELEDLHPELKIKKIVSATGGWPVLSVFEIDRNESISGALTVDSVALPAEFKASSATSIYALKLSGAFNHPVVSVNGDSIALDYSSRPSMEVIFSPDGGRLKFVPFFLGQGYKDDIYSNRNVELSKEDPRYLELINSGEGDVIYRIDSPTRILSMDIETRPRVFNDRAGQNSIIALYSTDDKDYKVLYEARSNGSGDWDHHFHRDTFHTIEPGSKTVFVKFLLKGEAKKTQLWSPSPVGLLGRLYSMKFIARIEPVDLSTLKLTSGSNRLYLKTLGGKGSAKLYFKE